MKLRRLAVNAASLAGGGIVAQICFVTIEAVIARHLGRDSYGAYGTVYAISLSIAVIADMGMSWKLIEEGSRNRTAIPRLLGTTFIVKLLFCAAIYPVALALLPAAGYGPEVIGFFAVFLLYAVLLVVQDTLAAVYSARQRMHVNALFQGATPAAILVCVLTAVWLSSTLPAIGWAYVAGGACVTAIWAWRTFLTERPRVQLRDSLRVLRGSYLYGLTAVLSQVNLRIDLLLLSLLRSLSEVGLFAAADKFADLGVKVGVMFSRVLAPMLFAQSHHEPQLYRRSCKIVLRGVSAFGALGCLTLALLAEPLLVTAFGTPFRAASAALALLAVSVFARLIGLALQAILSASGEHVRRTGSLAAALGSSVAASLALIPTYGIIGAAIARVTADGVYVGAMLSARNLPVNRSSASAWVFGPLAVSAVVYLLAQTLQTYFLFRFAAALVGYTVGLLATRLVEINELRELARILRAAGKI